MLRISKLFPEGSYPIQNFQPNSAKKVYLFFAQFGGEWGTIERVQQIAAHESPRTTKLYNSTQDEIFLEEVERIRI